MTPATPMTRWLRRVGRLLWEPRGAGRGDCPHLSLRVATVDDDGLHFMCTDCGSPVRRRP